MKVSVYDLAGKKKETIDLVKTFSQPIKKDLIKKAVLIEQSNLRQKYGVDPLAGKRSSAHYHGRRHIRHTMMNVEMARMKRIHGSGFLHFTARVVPQATKGRKAHPPKAEKNWDKKINKKERRKAILSAIAATFKEDIITKRGHKITTIKELPLIIEDGFEKLTKAKDVKKLLVELGLKDEMERVKEKRKGSGKGKLRGRRHKTKKGPLIILKDGKILEKAAKNMRGFDVVDVNNLTVDLIAPGAHPGRLCIWSKSAIESVEKL